MITCPRCHSYQIRANNYGQKVGGAIPDVLEEFYATEANDRNLQSHVVIESLITPANKLSLRDKLEKKVSIAA